MDSPQQLFAAIEAGGTKFICAVGDAQGRILDETRIATRAPQSTLADVLAYFTAAQRKFGALAALGVGGFGPLDLRPTSPTFGFITSTPKLGWRNTDLKGILQRGLQLPTVIDTDVNAAALGELRWGAGQGLESLVYVTVGTGVGVGAVHHGRAVHGLMHPELGHMMMRRHAADTNFLGICPFHGDCLEGLASGPAISARTGRALKDAAADAEIWSVEADYLGQLCALLVLSHAPQRIIMGGGVMQSRLYLAVYERMQFWLNNYVTADELQHSQYISAPGLGDAAGIKGALSLALPASVLCSRSPIVGR